MSQLWPDILARLIAEQPDHCRYDLGSAWFDDDRQWDQLGAQYDEAVQSVTRTLGPPSWPGYMFPGADVECAACWDRPNAKIAYAVWKLDDNTRTRRLEVGVCRRGDLQAASSTRRAPFGRP